MSREPRCVSLEASAFIKASLAQGEIIGLSRSSMLDAMRELLIQNSVSSSPSTFPIWKTVKLGTGLRTAKDFRQALEQVGCFVSDWAADILEKPAFSAASQATEVDLVKVTVSELGFPNGASVRDIYEKALKRGLVRCPAEVGPQLRLQYLDQPMNEWILVGMESIIDSDGVLEVFRVERNDGGLWLHSNGGHPDNFWDGDVSWVFVRPRKPARNA